MLYTALHVRCSLLKAVRDPPLEMSNAKPPKPPAPSRAASAPAAAQKTPPKRASPRKPSAPAAASAAEAMEEAMAPTQVASQPKVESQAPGSGQSCTALIAFALAGRPQR